MTSKTSWTATVLSGLACFVLGTGLATAFTVGFLTFVIGAACFVFGFAVQWRTAYRLRDVGAYCVVALVSFSALLALLRSLYGYPLPGSTEGLLLDLAASGIALMAGALAVALLRGSGRVPQFG